MKIPEKTDGIPLVFISYSHDSDEHKEWVRTFSTNLANNGVKVILDQWVLGYGHDLALFMEKGIGTADYVLMICTDHYVRRANERAGGVGYEALFLSSELLSRVATEKLIPVVRQAKQPRLRPAFIESRVFCDLSDGAQYESEFEDLLRSLHRAPRFQAPALGANPFLHASTRAQAEKLSSHRTELLAATSDPYPKGKEVLVGASSSPAEAFALGTKVASQGNIVAWKKLCESYLAISRQELFNWRALNPRLPTDESSAKNCTLAILSTHAGLLALSIAGCLSGQSAVESPAQLISRAINPQDWERSGMTLIVDAPLTIGWGIHLLGGAALMFAERHDIAYSLARTAVQIDQRAKTPVETISLTGWPPTLGNSRWAWSFITQLRANWPWLDVAFGDKHSYRAALASYLLALSTLEFAERFRRGERFKNYDPRVSNLWVPLSFLDESSEVQQVAISALLMRPSALAAQFDLATRDAAIREWTHWLAFCAQVAQSDHRHGSASALLARYADLVPTALSHS